VGSLNPETGAMNLLEDTVSPLEYQEKAHHYFGEERFKAAAYFYGEALKACAKQGADRDFECHLLRSRAVCFGNLGMQDLCLQDVERVLTLKPGDQQATELKHELRDGLVEEGLLGFTREAKNTADAPCVDWAKEGGVNLPERCGNCSKPVSRANGCGKCRQIFYCDRQCQRAHWKQHRVECIPCK